MAAVKPQKQHRAKTPVAVEPRSSRSKDAKPDSIKPKVDPIKVAKPETKPQVQSKTTAVIKKDTSKQEPAVKKVDATPVARESRSKSVGD